MVVLNKTDEDTQKAAAEVQLQKYGKFFDSYSNTLHKIEQTLLPYCPTPNVCPVRIKLKYEEETDVTEIINSNNKIIDKIVTVFSSLCSEVEFVKTEAKEKYINPILYYGEGTEEDMPYEDGQLLVSQFLLVLQDLSSFIKYCERLLTEILWQLSAFYDLHIKVACSNLYYVFGGLADVLLTLVVIQETIANNNILLHHWSLYCKTIQLASHSASNFSTDAVKINQLDKLTSELEAQLLSKRIFEKALSQPFDKKVPVTKNKRLAREFNDYMRIIKMEIDKATVHENYENTIKRVKLCLLFTLYVNLFSTYDQKFFKTLVDSLKKFPLINLYANVTINAESFLFQHIGELLKKNEKKLLVTKSNNPKQLLTDLTKKMNTDTQFYATQILKWMCKMDMNMKRDSSNLKKEYVKDVCNLLTDGINYSSSVKTILESVSNLHLTLKHPMAKTSALSLCKLTEILKCVEFAYYYNHIAISKLINYALQYTEYECLSIINEIKVILSKDKQPKEEHIDIVSSLVIAEECLSGPTTSLRLSIARLCLNLAGQMQYLDNPEHQRLPRILDKLSVMSDLQLKLESISGCPFMYWNRGTLPTFFRDVNIKEHSPNHLQYVIEALLDSRSNLRALPGTIDTEILQHQILHDLLKYVVNPLCNKVEENLRLQVLQHLQIGGQTLQKQNYQLANFHAVKPIYIANKIVDPKYRIENHLDKTFYDLTTVALHNWQTYREMKCLANVKFELCTIDDDLPNHSLEQGLDLLEITRNIHSFVENYCYNLNNQIFIEIRSRNKHLNTINIRHTSNSIRTHGAGIMSSAINYAYQFLRSKLNTFSQFMYDEQIKSRLIKDISVFKEQSEILNHRYTFERAEKLSRAIGKLGIVGEGRTTHLDQCRILITCIGNALGYVRMIRSGGLRYFNNVVQFIPNLNQITKFEMLCQRDKLSEACCMAARCLDDAVQKVSSRNITEGTDYFKLLVDVFLPVLNDEKNNHLRNFYIMVPALTTNFIEYVIMAKEGIDKRDRESALFTDDGFALGIAYMLQALNLYPEFDSLYWFQSVSERNSATIEKLTKEISACSKDNANLQHTLNLTLKRLQIYQKEFNLLCYNIFSARVLFESRNRNEFDE